MCHIHVLRNNIPCHFGKEREMFIMQKEIKFMLREKGRDIWEGEMSYLKMFLNLRELFHF